MKSTRLRYEHGVRNLTNPTCHDPRLRTLPAVVQVLVPWPCPEFAISGMAGTKGPVLPAVLPVGPVVPLAGGPVVPARPARLGASLPPPVPLPLGGRYYRPLPGSTAGLRDLKYRPGSRGLVFPGVSGTTTARWAGSTACPVLPLIGVTGSTAHA